MQGMPDTHLQRIQRVAQERQEIIINRPVSIWAKSLIECGQYPTKGFHVKGKSSDWGPHAGFIAADQRFSKVTDSSKAKGLQAQVDETIGHHDVVKMPLEITPARLKELVDRGGVEHVTDSHQLGDQRKFMTATRRLDGATILFCAEKVGAGDDVKYRISTVERVPVGTSPRLAARMDEKAMILRPFQVLGTSKGAMTADYDLLAICPKMNDRMMDPDVSPRVFEDRMQSYKDPNRRHPLAKAADKAAGGSRGTDASIERLRASMPQEDPHLGNITGRIRACKDSINHGLGRSEKGMEMVHHNADSGSLATDLPGDFKDGYGMTVFQPFDLNVPGVGHIASGTYFIESIPVLREYYSFVRQAGHAAPRNPLWKMPTAIDKLVNEDGENIRAKLEAKLANRPPRPEAATPVESTATASAPVESVAATPVSAAAEATT